MLRRALCLLAFSAALSGCSGGSGGSVLPSGQTNSGGGSVTPAGRQNVAVTIVIPAVRTVSGVRRPAYVSSNTKSAAISVNGGTPVVANLTPGSTNCTQPAAGITCTLSIAAPIGTDTFLATLYAGTNATGAALSTGTVSATIVAAQSNTVALSLGGVIDSISLALSPATFAGGQASKISLAVSAHDAAGATIIGSDPFVTPITLTDSDSSATSLSTTTAASPTAAAAVIVAYNGGALTSATFGATAGTIHAQTVTLKAQTTAAVAFNDYTTFGFDNQRDVYNPNTTALTPASVSTIHLGWQAALGGGDYNTQTQPILATGIGSHAGVLFVGGGSGRMYGYDATSGQQLWSTSTGQEKYVCEQGNTFYFGIGGTAAYDASSKSIYVVGNSNGSVDAVAQNTLFHLDAASGAVLGQVNFAPAVPGWTSLDFSHTSVTLNNGIAYVGTGATCDISSWRGRVAAISVPSMTLQKTFYTAWNGTSQPWGGGGVWGWGGVSLDFNGNVLTGVGNVDNGSTNHGSIVAPYQASPTEYSGLGDAFIKLSADLNTLIDSNHPIPTSAYAGTSVDLDLAGTPAVFQPSGTGCDPMAALQGKSGAIYLYDTARVGSGPAAQYQLAPSTYADGFLGGPAYSYATNLLYVAVTSGSGSLYPPGMIAINPGCGHPSVVWQTAFGPDSYPSGTPRSVPAASAGGVVFVGTMCTADGNGGCSGTATSAIARHVMGAVRRPLICCSPQGKSGGAVWALDASSGTVLNGGNPVITTSAPLRVPPTLDGNWLYVLDNGGNLYGLTIDSHVAAASAVHRATDSRMLKQWEPAP